MKKNAKEKQKRLHELIPAGGHTYSKGDDQFPEIAPGLMAKAKGAYCWDADGNKFLDYGMGLRSVAIGHANDEINEAVCKQISLGTNYTRPSVLELNLAEILVDLLPSVDMVKFAKNGSDVTSAAIRLARAYTGKKYIAVCAEHPFYSFNDWFIGSTACNSGIPDEVSSLTVKFNYNNIQSVEDLFAKYPNQIAAFILKPVKNVAPEMFGDKNFLQKLKELCDKNGALLILDEMISGFRFDLKGAQNIYNVEPHLSTFGKATANGFSFAFIGGKREIMELGGIHHNKPRVFLLSGTHGAESTGLMAAIKNIEIFKRDNVVKHHWDYGKKFKDGMNAIAKQKGIDKQFAITGFDCSPTIEARNLKGEIDLALLTLFSQEMIRNNVLIPWIAFSQSHSDLELDITLDAAEKALGIYKNALEDGVEKFLVGTAVKPVFRKFN
ncbi:MAG: glutamate-1-semialdehyde 2,1-aminomutase [Sphingobacteriaceae bacterium]|nr:glutamate-1-semialdehyde 2,1-aminomutase [Sphingobacteriaceae bacterium]